MRLTQPFRGWQLAIVAVVGFPTILSAHPLDTVTRVQALERADFPRAVVLVGALPDTIDEAAWDRALNASLQTWNEVSCSDAVLEYGGRVDAVTDAPENATTIAFVDGAADRCFAIDNDIGWTVAAPCDQWKPTAVLLNTNGYEWAEDPAPYQDAGAPIVDVRSVLTHELGHVLGLHHDDVTDPLATMAPRYLADGGLSSLSGEDKLALCALYPIDVWECSIDDPGRACGEGACLAGDAAPDGVCDEPRAQTGECCDLAELNCTSVSGGARCLASAESQVGYCTADCEADAECPDGMFCDPTSQDCRFDAGQMCFADRLKFAGGGGCATTAPKKGSEPLLLLGLAILCGRWRAASRNRRETCRDGSSRTCPRRARRPSRS